ncbi:MAG: hemin-degrading factor [Thiohalocapsa sp.]|nr:hemin-degrading factor [Thiohalocapsa sp.]
MPADATNEDAAPDSREALWQRWQALKAQGQPLRARDGALALGVSEAELVAAAPETRTLCADWGEVLEGLRAVGPVMSLTRNHAVVIEKTGIFEDVSIYPEHAMGQVVGEAIDLRLFLRHWRHGFAVRESARSGTRESLQFFDPYGVAVHKVYRVDGTDGEAWSSLIARFGADQPPQMPEILPETPAAPPKPDHEIDRDGLRAAWQSMTSTHDFFGLLRRFAVERRQALRLAGADLAYPVRADSYRWILEHARDLDLPLMLFVGNRGCIQIHTGPVARLTTVEHWYNVLDPDFNLHLREPAVSDCWVVRKPTERGIVTSLECYDDRGELLLQCFGKREGDGSESPVWRELVGTCPTPET